MRVKVVDCQPGWLIRTPDYWGHIAAIHRPVGAGLVTVTFWDCDGGGTRSYPTATRVETIRRI